MANSRTLIGLLDQPGASRDALAGLIGQGHFAVLAAAHAEELPAEVALVVAHVRAVPRQDWAALAARWPTIVISETRFDGDLLQAVDAGLIDYLVEPQCHGDVLRRLIGRSIEHHRLAQEYTRDRQRLAELNESLETHLAMLRLDQQAGWQIQRKLLPANPVTRHDVTAEYWLAPSLYLSGDFLDFQRCDARYSFFYFVDVSGHGASSAFVTVLLKYLSNRWLSQWREQNASDFPAQCLTELNRELLETGIGKHATVFAGVLDHERHYLHYSLGAQMPMPLLQVGREVSVLSGEGPPVGLFPHVEFPTYGYALPDAFRLWLCSDGILECLAGDTLDQRLVALKERVAQCARVDALKDALVLGDELPDDLTIMTLSGFDHA
ncbi:PP2C family protein-serine/threonine phosphatase [Chromohalobacter israelensis]|uniref:PP2C family protein-serine/threonine phosphatase n=1 Tax=Chromohalobacter israelensis TaxID=141390 RepID=UPI00265BA490|nr:PP2C family protein-serine/threonine phosphatase [Chromohalobacter salexigens]MDO0944901.1 PP2C family protein-serine/threonine phosphatase [Chromohalobacter salexigens]